MTNEEQLKTTNVRKEIKDMNREEVEQIQIQIVRYYADISRGHTMPVHSVKWVKDKINEPFFKYFNINKNQRYDVMTGEPIDKYKDPFELQERDLETGKFVISATLPRQA